MDVLVLGGTQWVGRSVSDEALRRGHTVMCLARGESGRVADGATLVAVDRSAPGAYDAVAGRTWDAVVEVSWQPGFVKAALAAVEARHWTYVSSGNVYLTQDVPGADESAPLMPPTDLETVSREQYGEAKRTCEDASAERYGDRLLVARAGLIGGPGDHTGRSGAWVARAARAPHDPMLVPADPDFPTQVVDVRDLAAWIVTSAETGVTGVYNAVGPNVPLGEWVARCRRVGGHDAAVIEAPVEWLLEQGVNQFMGPESIPGWIREEGWDAFTSRSGAAAVAAGLSHRDREEMVRDLLEYERSTGFAIRGAGLSSGYEAELIHRLLDPA